MIEIDEYVPVPSNTVQAKMDKSVMKAIARYSEAYRRVHRCVPVITYERPWIKINGVDDRVSKKRLHEMAVQLEYRASGE
jgi:hypothetical protein